MRDKFCFVGAYAASPCHSAWDPAAEGEYLQALSELKGIAGLELPFHAQIHRWDEAWLLRHLPKHWDHIVTCIPGVMETLGKLSTFGLASVDKSGRKAAIDFTKSVLQSVQSLNRAVGRNAVKSVEIHSAPTLGVAGVASSGAVFRESLEEILAWDWQGAKLLVEHCDRYVKGQEAAKGFLPLEEEIEAIKSLGNPKLGVSLENPKPGILINWGRSAIEGRSPDTAAEHIEKSAQSGALGGIIFSGATENDPLYGHWKDTHAPFGSEYLMTRAEVIRSLRASGKAKDLLLGFKIQALPKTLTVKERVEKVRGWLEFFDQCLSEA